MGTNPVMNLTGSFSFGLGAELIFFLLLLIFTVHGVFLAYHWFSYGTKKVYGEIALAAYVLGGAVLFITLALLLGKL